MNTYFLFLTGNLNELHILYPLIPKFQIFDKQKIQNKD